jgi:tRNA (mo5U34)-methyltransferase
MGTRRVVKLGGVEILVSLDERWSARVRALLQRTLGGGAGAAGTAAPAPVAALPADASPAQRALAERVAGIAWYHTLDLGGVVTPGFFDHRPHLGRYHLPESLAGKRVLDVATYNGFWAFELERRGAAEVVAVDVRTMRDVDLAPRRRAQMSSAELDRETGAGFALAHEVLGSRVRRETISVYDLSPERIGSFDLVFCGDLLLHLTDPIRALQRIRSVTRGEARLSEMFVAALDQSGREKLVGYQGGMEDFVWWLFSRSALEAMIRDAGFDGVTQLESFELVPRGRSEAPPHAVFRATP